MTSNSVCIWFQLYYEGPCSNVEYYIYVLISHINVDIKSIPSKTKLHTLICTDRAHECTGMLCQCQCGTPHASGRSTSSCRSSRFRKTFASLHVADIELCSRQNSTATDWTCQSHFFKSISLGTNSIYRQCKPFQSREKHTFYHQPLISENAQHINAGIQIISGSF